MCATVHFGKQQEPVTLTKRDVHQGRRRLRIETEEWAVTTGLMERFITAKAEERS
jgi:hypothetical protein